MVNLFRAFLLKLTSERHTDFEINNIYFYSKSFASRHCGRVVKATDSNLSIVDICFIRERRFKSCRCRLLYVFLSFRLFV